jgi:hypothetical protein
MLRMLFYLFTGAPGGNLEPIWKRSSAFNVSVSLVIKLTPRHFNYKLKYYCPFIRISSLGQDLRLDFNLLRHEVFMDFLSITVDIKE